ncbi:thermonuclease family protein [Anaerosphaera multitolerans]|uniref:Thermonuclease n=1 Tax=Anaerosphaera multitolerans TaxID=2487351 RepID=A0A437S5R6_9FIRM|nr:thermonuclease family protein [Anaerosphaera multitolerans]RVU54328.1 thermonuclease [Anaerosphaera multitolerans]
MIKTSKSLVILLLLLSLFLLNSCNSKVEENFESVIIDSVIDGDTVRLSSGEKIRIIGINTPEKDKEKLGKEAHTYVKDLIEGKKVYLEKDKSDRDQYERLLRYIWIEIPKELSKKEIETKNLSAILLKKGYARKYTFEPDIKYENIFQEIENEARIEETGMWEINKNGTTRGDKLNVQLQF